MNTDFVMVKTRRDLSGKDITTEWNVLMADCKLKENKYKKAKQNFLFILGHAACYCAIALLSNRK